MATACRVKRVSKPDTSKADVMGRKRREVTGVDYSARIAARLRELREKRGWTVDEVVEKVASHGFSTTRATCYKYESCTLDLPLNAIPAFASLYGMTVSRFMPPPTGLMPE